MDFAKVEAQFKDLREQFDAGSLTEEEFKSKLFDMMVQDEQGSWWMIGYESGQWYHHDGSQWQLDTPPIRKILPGVAPPETIVSKETKAAKPEITLSLDRLQTRTMDWGPVTLQASALLVVTLFMLALDINDLTDNARVISCYLLFSSSVALGTLFTNPKSRIVKLLTFIPAALLSALVLCLFLDDFYSPLSEYPTPRRITSIAAVLIGLGTLIPAFRLRQLGAIVMGAAAFLLGLALLLLEPYSHEVVVNFVFGAIGILGGLTALALTLMPVFLVQKQPEL